jgi:hypothetical protein
MSHFQQYHAPCGILLLVEICTTFSRAAAASPGLPWLSLSPVRVRRLCHTGSPIMPHRSSLQAGKPVISHTGYLSLLLCTDPSHCLRLPHSLPFFFFFSSALLTNPPGDQLDPPSLSHCCHSPCHTPPLL